MMKQRKFTLGTVVKLVLASLAVGLVLSFFGISPESIWRDIGQLARGLARSVVSFLDWGMGYILIGAAIVLPIFVVRRALAFFKGRRGR